MSATSVELEETPVAQDLTKAQQAGSARQNDLRSDVERRARAWRNLGNSPAEPSQRAGMAARDQPGDGWKVVVRRQSARMLRAGQKAATPVPLSSSAATAAMIPAWITARSHPSCSGFVGHTRSRPVSPHTRSTSGSIGSRQMPPVGR